MTSLFVNYVKSLQDRGADRVARRRRGARRRRRRRLQPAAAAFEVASIKPNNSGDGRVMMQMQPGRYVATNVTLRLLIRNAYQLQDFQITRRAGLDGVGSLRHQSPRCPTASSAARRRRRPAPAAGPLQLMIRALLAERFKLVVHNETKDAPIYALILARSDGKLGPRTEEVRDRLRGDVRGRARARRRDAAAAGPPQPANACRAGCASARAT